MARIIENGNGIRRVIKLSADDVISIIQEYQQIVNGIRRFDDVRDALENSVIYIPEG